ncbi:DUF1176 domain-containing protein [Commensalibacter oyaizuii]|uniref:DUF1176 domain-containing protein n=1 Tax=Commensalibacter oyaizuii TaxID=3043873 RepID=A0ABT6Q0N2_9PROT|nr:DUF1176 domain-containing protein [Commensalibacter sp. TBRC 16381]MDI2090639.1 DUF1176 domain-containing protein [Commensalibacter sp. TBRC 16381]
MTLGFGLVMPWATYGNGVTFEHNDWQVACDNTRTCRAAGYSPEDAKNRVTVLLTRKAGVGQGVTARVQFADIQDDTDKMVSIPDDIILQIDNKSYGNIGSAQGKDINDDSLSIPLTASQTQALLQALKGTSTIAFVGRGQQWILPNNGATAVLLKMDDVQGRVGTPSALIKKGNKSDDNVLPALPMPVVYQKSLLKDDPKPWQSKLNWGLLKKDLKKTKMVGLDSCDILEQGDDNNEQFSPEVIAVLNHKRLLISGICARGAYNVAYGYWIINQQYPYQPRLITTVANSGIEGNEIVSSMKNRGIGDCWSRTVWVWNGDDFIKTYDGDSGMCRMITAGGAWDLPTYIAKVK